MDFGDILDKWDKYQKENHKQKQRPAGSGKKLNAPSFIEKEETKNEQLKQKVRKESQKTKTTEDLMKRWILRYGVVDKDALAKKEAEEQRSKDFEYLRYMPIEASLDLHGMTRDEAWITLDRFVSDCQKRKIQKILIIHGKGNHSSESPVLYSVVRNFIEKDYRLGASGHPDKNMGGRGATWAIVRPDTENQSL